jgi:phosphoribosyl-AMP cyclohydrolase
MLSATPIVATDEQLAQVRYDANGLVPAIVQDHTTRQVLMMAWMSEETLRLTLSEGRKGDTSGDVQWVRSAHYDCDGDVLLFLVDQQGAGACHTGERSCFFRSFGRPGHGEPPAGRPGDDDPGSLPSYI